MGPLRHHTLAEAKLPGWAEGILKLDGMKGTARVRFADKLIDVEEIDASGGKFHIAGRYRQEQKQRRGAFLIETGPLAVGVAIDGLGSHVKLLGAKKWFREEQPTPSPPAGGSGGSPPADFRAGRDRRSRLAKRAADRSG